MTSAGESIAKNQEEEAKRVWRKADAVCFDVDSTVCRDEGIDDLAAFLGVGEAVANVTRTAMNGNARFRYRDALAARLQVMKPNKDQLDHYVNITRPKLTQGIKELVSRLQSRGTHVYLVSGGFRRLILPVAELLGIDQSRIYANEILFDKLGNYNGFDTSELTSDSGSKDCDGFQIVLISKRLRADKLAKNNHKYLYTISDGQTSCDRSLEEKVPLQNGCDGSDGATDAEAAPPADAFIGFGGNVVREAVKARAKWYVTDFDVLRKDLENDESSDDE
uniref:Phosphoserine phosphatase n=1 Tax=Caenorhabditis japonica TaxID=281687 RepID=A0A8R1DZ43_CAEJA